MEAVIGAVSLGRLALRHNPHLQRRMKRLQSDAARETFLERLDEERGGQLQYGFLSFCR